MVNKNLKKRFFNSYEFCENFCLQILLLWKGIYLYELPEAEDFYCHTKRVCKYFKTRNLEDCHDLYVQSDTLLLDDVFENFPNMCLEIYEFDSAHSHSATGLAWQAALKTSK